MRNLQSAPSVPSVAEVRARFPNLAEVTVPMLRRSFGIRYDIASPLLELAKRETTAEPVPEPIAELMRRFRFSEEEARWAYENVGMPE